MSEQHEKARSAPFGYVCNRCLRCCQHKIIQTNPYEIARLARNRGMTTTEFRAQWTEGGEGTFLRRREDDTCVFLTKEGCGVHPDRPLVCRLYPLGRTVFVDGTESWVHASPHPQTKGDYAVTGTIADYLKGQDVDAFIAAADAYAAWNRRAAQSLSAEEEAAGMGSGDAATDILDMDAAIADHCASTGETAPRDLEARTRLHLQILDQALDE